MAENTEFAHGIRYGDYSGVVFHGPPAKGFWVDRFAVSNTYIDPLFRAVLDRTGRETDGESLPLLVAEWNTLSGWAELGAGIVPVSVEDASDLAGALHEITDADLAPHITGTTAQQCLRCAAAIQEFIRARVAQNLQIYLEND
jgi:hypothetical protein